MIERESFIGFIIAVVSACFSFFAEIHLIFYAILFAVLFDCLTAIIKKWNNYKPIRKGLAGWFEKWSVIRSKGLKRTIAKLILYILFVALIYLVEIALIGKCVYIANFVAFIILFSEAISIAENLDIIFVTDRFTIIIKKVRKMFEKKITNQISNDMGDDENE
jgi:hypothetical protein